MRDSSGFLAFQEGKSHLRLTSACVSSWVRGNPRQCLPKHIFSCAGTGLSDTPHLVISGKNKDLLFFYCEISFWWIQLWVSPLQGQTSPSSGAKQSRTYFTSLPCHDSVVLAAGGVPLGPPGLLCCECPCFHDEYMHTAFLITCHFTNCQMSIQGTAKTS